MKILRNFLFISAITVAFVSCSDDDDNGGGGTGGETPDGNITSQTDVDLVNTALKGNVTGDITLDAATQWTLTGALAVKSGATLTIEAGTTILAADGGTDVYIAIEQGAQIDARGTAANPIVITSAATNPRPGSWGGLLLAGRAPINSGDTALAEVISLRYGGDQPDDNSGTLTYVRVEYTGAKIGGEQEFNGISFYGVGSATTVNHVAALFGADDGIEWFGGTVNVTNALVVNCVDDWFDWTEGWTGQGSNFYGIRTADFLEVSGDPRGIEADSNENDIDASPRSNPTIDGITLVNQAPQVTIIDDDGVEKTVDAMADMIKIRRGSSVTITNGLVALLGDGTAGDFIDLTDSKGYASGDSEITVVGANIDITDIIFDAEEDQGDPQFPATTATVNTTGGNTGGANSSVFAWTNFTFPTIEVLIP